VSRQTLGAHAAPCLMGIGAYIPEVKVARAKCWSCNTIYCRGLECVEQYFHGICTPVCHGS